MIVTFLIRLLQTLALVAVQVLVLNHIRLWGYCVPMIHVCLLLYFPLGSSRVATLLWAFVAGLVVDVFSNTPGVGCGAMTLAAMAQPGLLRLMVPRDAAEDVMPTYRSMGARKHVTYVMLIYLIHHLAYFMLETFSFANLTLTLLSMAGSWFLSVVLALTLESLRGRER